MLEKYKAFENRFDELGALLSDPEVISNTKKLSELAKERSDLESKIAVYHDYIAVQKTMAENQSLIDENEDPELTALAEAENETHRAELIKLEEQLKFLLIPTDPNDSKNALFEIRAGTGGDEAGLFVGDLLPYVYPLRRT